MHPWSSSQIPFTRYLILFAWCHIRLSYQLLLLPYFCISNHWLKNLNSLEGDVMAGSHSFWFMLISKYLYASLHVRQNTGFFECPVTWAEITAHQLPTLMSNCGFKTSFLMQHTAKKYKTKHLTFLCNAHTCICSYFLISYWFSTNSH